MTNIIFSTIKNNDVVLVMGAGSIGELSKNLVTKCDNFGREGTNG